MTQTYSEDSKLIDESVSLSDPSYLKTCALCGKPFVKDGRRKVCPRKHYRVCKSCGSKFYVDEYLDRGIRHLPETCSKTCKKTLLANINSGNSFPKTPRVCAYCGKEFLGSGTSKYCEGPHYKKCAVCGKQFEVDVRNIKETCSPGCASKLSTKTFEHTHTRKCKWCGEEFRPRSTSDVYCDRSHYSKCPICGKTMEVVKGHESEYPKCCSSKCSSMLRQKTCLKKYGVNVISKSEQSRKKLSESYFTSDEHRKKTCLNRYGVTKSSSSLAVRHNISDTCKSEESQRKHISTMAKKYGYEYPSQVPEIKAKQEESRRETCLREYGSISPSKSSLVKEKIKSSINSEECRRKMIDTSRVKYGADYPAQSKCVQDKIRETMKSTYGVEYPLQNKDIHHKQRVTMRSQKAVDGTLVDSSYEKLVYDFCVRNDISFEYQSRQIEYEYNGKKHVTTIDFVVDGYLLECKGTHLLNGIYDGAPHTVPISKKIDVYKKNHVVVVTSEDSREIFGKPNSKESNGLKYGSKCPNPLIGIDVSLFGKTPKFPYRDDRPECFYDVKVDGKASSHDAFYDESIRWSMIKNRIEYSGGFIDNKQILNALNITRTCKQPSWFSKSLAKRLITSYCTEEVIVDPFAGWGARCDAANELRRGYRGLDYNKDLVDWHHTKGRNNISYGDANVFTYDGVCSVLICPPYSDPRTGRCFEDYNFDGFDDSAKSLSQCDWLKIVMKNVPNAKQYVMVCKIVDSGFEAFVKDKINRKSHFGDNFEYVVVIEQSDRELALSI